MTDFQSDNAPSQEELKNAPLDKAPEFDADDSPVKVKPDSAKDKADEGAKAEPEKPQKSQRDVQFEEIAKASKERQQREREAVAATAPKAAEAAEEPPADAEKAEDDKPKRRVKINGEFKEISEEDYARAAMRGLAGDDRLAKAKEEESRIKELKRQIMADLKSEGLTPQQQTQEKEPENPQEREASAVEKARREYDRALVYGTEEDQDKAFQALAVAQEEQQKQLTESIKTEASREAIAEVQRANVERSTDQEIRATITEIGERLPDLVKDPMLAPTTRNHIHNSIAHTLVSYINNPEVSPEEVRVFYRERGYQSPQQLLQDFAKMDAKELQLYYNRFRAEGHDRLPLLGNVAKLAATQVAMRFNLIPAKSDSAPSDAQSDASSKGQGDTQPAVKVDRSDRKAAIENQPGRTSLPRQTETATRKLSERERANNAFQKVADRKGRKLG